MSVFRDYFKKTLRFLPVQKPGAIAALCEGGAGVLDTAREAVLWLRDQFHPERCSEDTLSRFAESRGISRFSYESDEQYFGRIRWAYSWYVKGGRDAGMLWILQDGYSVENAEVINLRNEDPLRWAEFAIKVENFTGQALLSLPSVIAAINEVKPARSKFAGFRLKMTTETATRHVGASGPVSGGVATIYPFGVGSIDLPAACGYRGAAFTGGTNTVIYPQS